MAPKKHFPRTRAFPGWKKSWATPDISCADLFLKSWHLIYNNCRYLHNRRSAVLGYNWSQFSRHLILPSLGPLRNEQEIDQFHFGFTPRVVKQRGKKAPALIICSDEHLFLEYNYAAFISRNEVTDDFIVMKAETSLRIVSSDSVSEKGSVNSLGGPKDHYELKLPWLLTPRPLAACASLLKDDIAKRSLGSTLHFWASMGVVFCTEVWVSKNEEIC